MASYKLELKRSAEKDLRKLPREALARVVERLASLQSDPFPARYRKLTDSEHLYRLRVGDYRIVYEVETGADRIIVHSVRHRREVYRSL